MEEIPEEALEEEMNLMASEEEIEKAEVVLIEKAEVDFKEKDEEVAFQEIVVVVFKEKEEDLVVSTEMIEVETQDLNMEKVSLEEKTLSKQNQR